MTFSIASEWNVRHLGCGRWKGRARGPLLRGALRQGQQAIGKRRGVGRFASKPSLGNRNLLGIRGIMRIVRTRRLVKVAVHQRLLCVVPGELRPRSWCQQSHQQWQVRRRPEQAHRPLLRCRAGVVFVASVWKAPRYERPKYRVLDGRGRTGPRDGSELQSSHHGRRTRAARAYNILGCVASWARVDSVLVKLEKCSRTTRDVRGKSSGEWRKYYFMVGRGDGSPLALNVKLPPAARLHGMGGGAPGTWAEG